MDNRNLRGFRQHIPGGREPFLHDSFPQLLKYPGRILAPLRLAYHISMGGNRNVLEPFRVLGISQLQLQQATIRLMNELEKGRKSGEEKGWLSLEAVEETLGLSHE